MFQYSNNYTKWVFNIFYYLNNKYDVNDSKYVSLNVDLQKKINLGY